MIDWKTDLTTIIVFSVEHRPKWFQCWCVQSKEFEKYFKGIKHG